MKTYGQVHAGLCYFFGPASNHTCTSCPSTAAEWAYLHTAGDEEVTDEAGRAYSENLEFYTPLCKPCHRRFDSKRMWENPQTRAALAAASATNLTAWRERVARDPQAAQRMRDGWARGAEARKRKLEEDLAYREDRAERWRRAGLAASQKRRRCSGCDRVMAAGPLGSHQKSTGHTGYGEM